MKRNNLIILIVGVLMLGLMLTGCKRTYVSMSNGQTYEEEDRSEVPMTYVSVTEEDKTEQEIRESEAETEAESVRPVAQDLYEPGELVCLADTEEEAKKIAEMYNIELQNYSYGVATFFAGKDADLEQIISDGIEKGYPELSLNYIYSIID